VRADLLIISPLKAELEPALARLGEIDGPPLPLPAPALVRPYRTRTGRVLAGWTGIGAEATRRAIEAALARCTPGGLLHVGVAGALAPDLDTGDVVVCERLLVDAGDPAPLELPGAPWLRGLGRTGAAVTVERVVTTAEAKRALFERSGAHVVEMESYWAVAAARARGLPVGCVRVVCDRHDETLPDLTEALDPVGRPRTLRLLRRLVAEPGVVAALPRVARAFGVAQAALTAVVLAAARAADPGLSSRDGSRDPS
jgi:nucleoside phosphorylase